jgi:hypothetical protein
MPDRPRRPSFRNVRAAALLILIGCAVGSGAASLILDRGTRVYVASSQQIFTHSRFFTGPALLHALRVESHGGITRIEWYDGAWTPLAPRTGSYVSLYVDERRVASALLGGYFGSHESRPGSLIWVGRLTRGPHLIEIRVDRAGVRFAIPFTRFGLPVADGLLVTEYTGS